MHLLALKYQCIGPPLVTGLFLLLIPASYATCYFPSGKLDTNYRQCPNSLSCCLEGESCLSNGLCFTANFGILYRGACADKSWPSGCPRACFNEIPDAWANLFQCTPSASLMTCTHQDTSAGTACQDGHGLGKFEYSSANVTAAQNGITNDNSTQAANAITTTSFTTTSPTSPSTTSLNPETTASDSPQSASTASPSCPSTNSPNQSKLIAIGVGLGAGLGVSLLISTALVIYCMGLRRRQQEQLNTMSAKLAAASQQWDRDHRNPSIRAELHGFSSRPTELVG